MRRKLLTVLLLLCAFPSFAQTSSIEGRWDITIIINDKPYPSWLEVEKSGSKRLVGSFVGISGSARPVSIIHFVDNKISFSLPPQWEREDNDLKFEGVFEGDSLTGMMTGANGQSNKWSAVRAPMLKRDKAPVWGKAVKLLKDGSLDGWQASGNNQWVVENGILKSPRSGANLITTTKYNDFKLHIEFRYAAGSNSGVYLRGRYEVQIEDNKGRDPEKHLMGAIYGFLTPSEMAAKEAGEWQSYDITLIGRMVNIVANGKTIICNQEIPGITGGALDSREGEAGPIYLQGDHGPIEYRNIIITPAQ